MNIPSQVTILCEDQRTYHFARGYLQKCGIQGTIHSKICPPAKKSCFDYVIEEYSKEVATYRQKKNHLNLALVVIVDGDSKSDERLKKLESQVSREKSEKIAIFIPNRNIETWFEYVTNPDSCDDKTDYKNSHKDTKPTNVATQFKEKVCQAGWKPRLLPSLEVACNELGRLGL